MTEFSSAGQSSTQELFHPLNHLHDHNKQGRITSGPAAKTSHRLRGTGMRSASSGGLITTSSHPTLRAHRHPRKKGAERRNSRSATTSRVHASKVSSNIRELEGTLIRVTAFANLNGTPVRHGARETVLKDLITLDETTSSRRSNIINHTADTSRLSVDDLYGSSRSQAVATARQSRCTCAARMTNLSLPRSASCSATATTQR